MINCQTRILFKISEKPNRKKIKKNQSSISNYTNVEGWTEKTWV
jgi:hypothetical protein